MQDVRRVYSEEPSTESDKFKRFSTKVPNPGGKSGHSRLSTHPFGRRAEGDGAEEDRANKEGADRGDGADRGAADLDGAGDSQSYDPREPDPESEPDLENAD